MATGVEVHKREVDEIEMDESKKMKLEETVIRIPSPQKLNGVRDPSPARLSNGASSPTKASIFKDVSSVHNASPQPASPLKMEVPSQQSPRKMDSGVSSPSRMETGHSSPVRETRLPSPSNAIREAHPNRVSVIANVSTIEVAPMEEVVQERAKSPMRASSPQTRAPSPPKNEASLPRVSSPQRIEVCASPVRSPSPARAAKSPVRAEPASPFRAGKSPVRDEPAAPIIATELNVEQPSGDLPSALPSAVASEFTDVVSGAAEGNTAADETLVKAQLKHCLNVVKILKRSKNAHWFSQPVDPVALNIPHYPTIVKNPMDLGTIEKKLNENVYTGYQQVVDDVNLMVDNCILFNGKEAAISGWAIDLQKMMKKHMQKLPLSLDQKPKKRNSEKLPTHVDTVRPRRDVHAPPREYNAVTSPSRRSKKHTPEYKFAYAVHRELVGKKHYLINWPFLAPVDWKALNIPTYPEIIKHPMDLSTVKKKLDYDEYEALDDIENDFRLIFNNCFTFNNPMDDVYLCGKKLEQVFYEKWSEKNKFLSQYGVAKKSRPSSGMYDDSSDESSDDEMNQQQINMLQQNLMMMNSQLAMLMENRKKKKKKRKSLPNPALAAVPGAKKSVSKRKRSSVGGSTIGKKMKKDYISDDEEIKGMQYEAIPELSIEQKMYVSQNIETLNPEQLQRVLALIKEGMPNVAEDGSDEIELDINSMDKRTLFRLHSYIRTCKAAGLKTGDVRKYPTSSSGSSSSGSESSDSGSD